MVEVIILTLTAAVNMKTNGIMHEKHNAQDRVGSEDMPIGHCLPSDHPMDLNENNPFEN